MKELFIRGTREITDCQSLLELLQSEIINDEEIVGLLCEDLRKLVEGTQTSAEEILKVSGGYRLLFDLLKLHHRSERIIGNIGRILCAIFPVS